MSWYSDLTATQWMLAALAALSVGLAKSGFGGFGMVAVLLMAEVLPARLSTGALLPLLIFADVVAVSLFRRHLVWRHLAGLFIPTALGVVAGYLMMPHLSDAFFRRIIGIIVLSLALLQAIRMARPHAEVGWFAEHATFLWLIGALSGLTTMLANAAGAVMTIYLLARRVPKMEFVGTAAVFFLFVNLFKVPFSVDLGLIQADSLAFNLRLLPAVLIGLLIGRLVLGVIPQRFFEILLLLFAMISSSKLVFG